MTWPISRRAPAVAAAAVAVVAAAGCRQTLDDRPWLVTAPRLVGWQADPPEAPPGATVVLRVVVVDPAGSSDTAATSWTLCRLPKPLDENRVVAAGCLDPRPADATGDPVQIAVPADACRVFGPDVPQPARGAPMTRPRDPDATGGYYQPIAIAFGASLSVGLLRVSCDLPDASLAAARAFQAAYHPNQNPAVACLAFTVDGAPIDPAAVPAGARVAVEATWPASTAEPFPIFDRATGTVTATVETLGAAWFVTGGSLDRAAADISDPGTLSAATTWQAPGDAGTFQIVFVLRDSRGGAGVARAALTVAGGR